jgi:photosystem II stability/assembly factor-like uncharacterized protein
MNDTDFDPVFEAEIRAELHRTIVPPCAPAHVREAVEGAAEQALKKAQGRRALGRRGLFTGWARLAAAVAIVAVVALVAAILAWDRSRPAPLASPTATATPSATPNPGPTIAPGTGLHLSVTPDGGGFVYVEGDGLRATTDFGATWSEARQVPPGDSGQDHLWDVSTLQFIDSQHGWMTGVTNGSEGAHVTSYRTADGGRTWQATPVASLARDPSAGRDSFVGAQHHFIDALHGWIVIDRITPNALQHNATCQRYSTADGGASWAGPAEGSCVGLFPSVRWVTNLVGYAVPDFDRSTVWVTTDAGSTWRSAHLPGVSPARTVSVDLMAVDETGRLTLMGSVAPWPAPHAVYASSDSGASWSQLCEFTGSPGPVSFNWAEVLDPERWLVSAELDTGQDRLFQTEDSGRTWTAVEARGRPGSGGALWWNDRQGLTETRDPTCGDSCEKPPLLYATGDGGLSWRQVVFPDS